MQSLINKWSTMPRRAGQANSDKSHATSDPRVLSLCCQGVGHAFNFDQSQVRSHEGLTCVRVCGFCKLGVFDKVDRVLAEYSLVRACFRLAPLFFFSACSSIHRSVRIFVKIHCLFCKLQLSIHQSQRVFDKVHCVFCKLKYLSVRVYCR